MRGIIHRDIKPSNLLLDTAGVVWITDFGLAKTQDVALTTTGDIVGTLRYMAPERFQGEGDERSDVYALGLTLYELLVLRPAFESQDRLNLVDRIKNEEPARPRALDRRIPRDLETIILKAIHKEPKRRYQTAEAMAEDLRRFLANEPIKAKRTSQLERLRLWSRRNPALAALLVVLALFAIGATTTAFYLRVMLNDSEEAHRQEKEAKREARLHEANALVGQAHGTRLSRRPGQRFEALDSLGKAAAIGRELGQPSEWFDRLRNEAIAALALPDIHITHEFGSFPPGSSWVELNDDFTLYVRTTDKGECVIRRVDDDKEVGRLRELGEPAYANFGLGRILAVRSRSGRFQLWDLDGEEAVLRIAVRGIHCWRFRNDGRLLALSYQDGSISVYETASGKCVHQLAPGQIVRGSDAHLHPTAPFVACCSYYHHDVQVRDLRSGAVVATAVPPWRLGSNACWSPDGRTLLVADSNHSGIIQEYAFDPAVGALRLVRNIQGPDTGGAESTFNPAGDRFVRRGWGGSVVLFDTVTGQELFRTHSLLPASHTTLLRFDRTGQRLAGARVGDRKDRIGLWSVADAREYRSLSHAGNSANDHTSVFPSAIHPAGRLAAMGSTDGVALFDLETGRVLERLPINNRPSWVSFDGTGNMLTNGFEGFFRWPVKSEGGNPCRLTIGPPVRLPFHPGDSVIASNHNGRVIAQCMWNGYGMAEFAGGWILHPNSPTPRRVNAGTSIGRCSVSPDGRWVAFGGPYLAINRAAINVYEAATAQRVWQSPVEGDHGLFSPDGRWLVTDTDGGRLYEVGTWERGPQLGPGTPWTVASHLAVFGQSNGIYRLVELATARELARLEDPELNNGEAALTPDGTKLVVSAKNGLRVWDLRRIRTELAKLGLDWDAPPLPAASAAPAAPLSIHAELGDLLQRAQAISLVRQANQYTDAKEHGKALELLRQAVKIDPNHAMAHNNLAWLFLTGPKELRDPAQALIEAKKAVELEPKESLYVNTQGVALYYMGQFADAIPILERSLREQKGKADAFDLFFLAMCHHCLGDAAKAKECLERGKQWFGKHKGKLPADWVEELTAFQAEADAVLGQPPGQMKK